MPIFQYQCHSCSGIFEYFVSSKLTIAIDCVSCGGDEFTRLDSTCFYPNKNFCPHDKELDHDMLKSQIAGIMGDKSKKCGGCGVDGAPGSCSSKGGRCACKSGECSSGGCGNKQNVFRPNSKLSLDLYSSKL